MIGLLTRREVHPLTLGIQEPGVTTMGILCPICMFAGKDVVVGDTWFKKIITGQLGSMTVVMLEVRLIMKSWIGS